MILAVFALLLHMNEASNVACIHRACSQGKSKAIVCNQSLILISDVKDWRMKSNHDAVASIKRICTGRESCDPSKVCFQGPQNTLYIYYVCDDAKNVYTSTCNGTVFEIPTQHGFIQSPNYPLSLSNYKPCQWRITAPNDSLVFLTLHDIDTSVPGDKCNGGLTICYRDCVNPNKNKCVHLCGSKDDTSVDPCGPITISLSRSNKIYPLRFWLGFRVVQFPMNQQINTRTSDLTCSGRFRSTDTVTTLDATMVTKETDTRLLIILLSVVSSVAGALIIILIVVCIRCRLMRMTVSDHVYCKPSPALQAHYDYISSLETDRPQPELADEYFEVADALPYSLRPTPASPAYAEVEQFIDFKRGPQSSADSTEWADCQSQYSNADGPTEQQQQQQHDETGESASSPGKWKKKKPLGEELAKNVLNQHKLGKNSGSPKLKKSGWKTPGSFTSSEPKVFVVNLEQSVQESSPCDDNSAYEQVEVHSSGDIGYVMLSKSRMPANRELEQINTRKATDLTKATPQGTNRHNKSSSHKSRVDQIKEGFLSKHNDQKDGIYSKAKELGLQKMPSPTRKDRNSRPSTPEKKQKSGDAANCKKCVLATDADEETRKSQKPLLLKDRIHTSGIVRNGIQKFESN